MLTEVNTNEIKRQIEDTNFKRYVLSVVAGQEELVIENLIERIKKQELQDQVNGYLSPVVSEYSLKKGEKITKTRKLYPGYVFIESKMNDKIRYVIRNTPGVRLIVGAETRPIPLSQEEYENIVKQVEKSLERAELVIPFKTGDVVLLKTGDFKGMKGVLKNIDESK